jgi:hypothetical protein
MKTSVQSGLIVFALLVSPVLIILLKDFINIIIIIFTFSISLFLTTYYLYIDIKAELDWKKNQIEQLTHGFDAEKMRFFKFFMAYFNK